LQHMKEQLEAFIQESEALQSLNIQFDRNPMQGY